MLNAAIGIGNRIINLFNDWITKYVELLSDKEVKMSNMLIDLQIEQVNNKQTFENERFRIVLSLAN